MLVLKQNNSIYRLFWAGPEHSCMGQIESVVGLIHMAM